MKPVRAVRRGVINAEIEKVFSVIKIIIMPNFRYLNILEINENYQKLRFGKNHDSKIPTIIGIKHYLAA